MREVWWVCAHAHCSTDAAALGAGGIVCFVLMSLSGPMTLVELERLKAAAYA